MALLHHTTVPVINAKSSALDHQRYVLVSKPSSSPYLPVLECHSCKSWFMLRCVRELDPSVLPYACRRYSTQAASCSFFSGSHAASLRASASQRLRSNRQAATRKPAVRADAVGLNTYRVMPTFAVSICKALKQPQHGMGHNTVCHKTKRLTCLHYLRNIS